MALKSAAAPSEDQIKAAMSGVMVPVNVSLSPGLVTSAGKTVTASCPGAKTTDVVQTVSSNGAMSLGVTRGDCWISAPDTLSVQFLATTLVGVTLGSMTLNVILYRTT
jgi:hypothetical protein